MKFEIDVSGYDLFCEGYTICIASDCGIIKGCKLKQPFITTIQDNWSKGIYRYRPTIGQRGLLKVRIYSAIVHYLFKSIDKKYDEIDLVICRDFACHENDIKQNLTFFLEKLQGKKIKSITFEKLPLTSNAHGYAYLMNKDKYNLLPSYVDVDLKDIEPFLKRKLQKKKKNVKGKITEP